MKRVRPHLLLSLCCALLLPLSFAYAQDGDSQASDPAETRQAGPLDRIVEFSIAPQGLDTAMIEFANQSGIQVVTPGEKLARINSPGVTGSYSAAAALDRLLAGTDIRYEAVGDATIALTGPGLNGASVAGQNTVGQRRKGIEEIIVTGQKREERIQDVPIAISAFSQKDLEAQKLEGGFDLVKAIPNVSFSKTNFTSYNFQIRGVGTQAISATTDPGVAVSFNNTAIIQNRLFEQEYLDVERVEVLRGPQGTLYGRNATAGVINVITNKPEMGVWDGSLKLETGNYNTQRLRGMFNMPIGDTLALRGAYAGTDRDGYTYNSGTGNRVDGRKLWTGRLSLGWQPTDRFRTDLIWEHFDEDDNRLRTGKQLCHRDDGPLVLGDSVLADNVPGYRSSGPQPGNPQYDAMYALFRSRYGQGCEPGDLYTDGAFDTPNGLSFNFINGILTNATGSFIQGFSTTAIAKTSEDDSTPVTFIQIRDPYGGRRQSRDLRKIESIRDPKYRANADLFQLNIDFDVTDTLTFSSQTIYDKDETYSFQDFNRFNTDPIFTDTTQYTRPIFPLFGYGPEDFRDYTQLAPGGVFCDPQIGCSNKLASFDIAQADARQFNQEFRLQSAFSGPINFSVGANYTKFKSVVDYFIFSNVLTALATSRPFNLVEPGTAWDPGMCASAGYFTALLRAFGALDRPPFVFPEVETGPVPTSHPGSNCPYIDPNPIDTSRNFGTGGNNEGEGHNYFRSKNPYELESWAGFGEVYWNIQDDLKLTVGLRYTEDTKTFTPVPTQVLLAPSVLAGGDTAIGYPEEPPIEQKWGEWTGRIVLDWQPVLNFTDETLIYGSFSRGYKGGGANPPRPDVSSPEETLGRALEQGYPQWFIDSFASDVPLPVLPLSTQEYGDTFDPEFVNAYEIGTKNTLFGGAVTLNATAFYYDYSDYQVSQIRDRTAINENFDASMWGLEFESVFVPTPNWQFLANIGYLNTAIARGETSIDIMNRTQGNPNYQLVKPWPQLPSNCVVPTPVAELQATTISPFYALCGIGGLLGSLSSNSPTDPATGEKYDPADYPALNGGAGLLDDIGGNELPQSPNLTVTLGGQYSFDLTPNWRVTTRLDYYWQDDSYHRIYNDEPYDHLRSWSNTNLSFWVESEKYGLKLEGYVKNLFDNTPITGAFLNSDDTGLTTNVFMFDPRLIGLSVRKDF